MRTLSAYEEQYVALDRQGAGATYNVAFFLRVEGPVDLARLKKAWLELFVRHEALRTRFVTPEELGDSRWCVAVTDAPHTDFSDTWQERKASSWEECLRLAREDVYQPFDLARRVTRAAFVTAGPRLGVLVVVTHHSMCDIDACRIMARDLRVIYSKGGGALPEPPNYCDSVARAQRHAVTGPETLKWWKEQLEDVPEYPDLPRDAHSQKHEFKGGIFETRSPPATLLGLRKVATESETTMWVTLLAAWLSFLARHGTQEHFAVHVTISGREKDDKETVGCFVHTVPVVVDVTGEYSLKEFVRRVKTASEGSLSNAHAPSSEVNALGVHPTVCFALRGKGWKQAIIQGSGEADDGVVFKYMNEHPEDLVGDLQKFELVWGPEYEDGKGLWGTMGHSNGVFESETARGVAQRFETYLKTLAEAGPEANGRVPLVTASEAGGLLAFNPPETPQAPELLHEGLERQAARKPGATVSEDTHGRALTYDEVNRRANQIARKLLALGVRKGKVPVCIDRRADCLVGMYAALKAGCSYVPIDPAYPPDRIAYMLENCGATVVIAHAHLAAREDLHLGALGRSVVLLDDPSVWGDLPSDNVTTAERGELTPGDLAYVLYTSGSTGKPKGVAMPHRGPVNIVNWARRRYEGALDCVGAVASLCFDISGFDLFVPAGVGGKVLWFSNVLELITCSQEHFSAPTYIMSIPSGMHEVALQRGVPPNLNCMSVGGEPIKVPHVESYQSKLRLFDNIYGPTEASILCSFSTGTQILTIGNAPPNYQLYVVDPAINLLPVGVPGELLVGGHADSVPLAQGYLGREELTAEKFIPSPFGPGKVYKTGDIAAWTDEGVLRFLGRNDDQVKIRGFRVELGEVEKVILTFQGVAECIVLPVLEQLVAFYVVIQGEVKPEVLRKHSAGLLTRYMVPTLFMATDKFPHMPNGKVNRKRLKELAIKKIKETGSFDGIPYEAPRTATEHLVGKLFCDVLGVLEVGCASNFFELGGHSLLAMRFLGRLRAETGYEFGPVALHSHPTVEAFSELLEARTTTGKQQEALPPVPSVDASKRSFVLSSTQEAFLHLEAVDGSGLIRAMPLALRLKGDVNETALQQAVSFLYGRHSGLRTILDESGGSVRQRQLPPTDKPLVQVIDEASENAVLKRELSRPFKLVGEPLVRVFFLRRSSVLLIMMHHVLGDGWSLGLVVDELLTVYSALASGTDAPQLPPAGPSPAAYAAWERGPMGPFVDRDIAVWKERLQGLTPPQLPTDVPRHGGEVGRRGVSVVTVRKEQMQTLKSRLGEQSTTLFHLMTALSSVLFARLSAEDDVAFGVPVAVRPLAEMETMVACAVNVVIYHINVDASPTLAALVAQVREKALAAAEHPYAPLERVAESVPGVLPATKILVNKVDLPERDAAEYVDLLPLYQPPFAEDLVVTLFEGSESFRIELWYNNDLFGGGAGQRMGAQLKQLFDTASRESWSTPLSKFEVCSPKEKTELLAFNPPVKPAPPGLLHEGLERQAERTPEAVVSEDTSGRQLTYREVNGRANQLARKLIEVGVRKGDFVPVCVERRADCMVGIYAALKAGCAYLPIDPTYPPERLAFMMDDSGARVVIAHSHVASRSELRLKAGGRVVLSLDDEKHYSDLSSANLTPAERGEVTQDDIAYVIYTSGSTGKPKGVAMRHRGPVNFVQCCKDIYGGDLAVSGAVTSLSFDPSVGDLFAGPSVGGRVIWFSNVTELLAIDESVYNSITWVIGVPSGFFEVATQRGVPRGLRSMVMGGEAMKESYVATFQSSMRHFHNAYGPTEASIMCSLGEREHVLSIGSAMQNYTLFVADKHFNLVPINVVGELFIGGGAEDVPLAEGYLNRPELTAERFVRNPWGEGRVYRTGDLVCWLPSGNVRFIGRNDDQVKVRGFRVELGEVEAAVNRVKGVSECVVLAHNDKLIAFYAGDATDAQLRGGPVAAMPRHMVPASFIRLDKIPLMPNGKVNRVELKQRLAAAPPSDTNTDFEAPAGPLEEAVAQAFCSVLDLKRAGRNSGFFALGGHSLRAVRLLGHIRTMTGIDLPIAQLHENDTVAALAAAVSKRKRAIEEGGDDDSLPLQIPHLPEPVEGVHQPLSSMQEAFWILDKIDTTGLARIMPMALQSSTPLDVATLSSAVDVLVERHEALRTVLEEVDGTGLQRVTAPRGGMLQVSTSSEADLEESMAEEFTTPFQILGGPLIRFHLLALPAPATKAPTGGPQPILAERGRPSIQGPASPPVSIPGMPGGTGTTPVSASHRAYGLSPGVGSVPARMPSMPSQLRVGSRMGASPPSTSYVSRSPAAARYGLPGTVSPGSRFGGVGANDSMTYAPASASLGPQYTAMASQARRPSGDGLFFIQRTHSVMDTTPALPATGGQGGQSAHLRPAGTTSFSVPRHVPAGVPFGRVGIPNSPSAAGATPVFGTLSESYQPQLTRVPSGRGRPSPAQEIHAAAHGTSIGGLLSGGAYEHSTSPSSGVHSQRRPPSIGELNKTTPVSMPGRPVVRFAEGTGEGGIDAVPVVGSYGANVGSYVKQTSFVMPGQEAPAAARRMAGAGSVLLVTMHHLFGDAWALGVLANEVLQIYTSLLRGVSPELPLVAQPVLYAQWERGPMTKIFDRDIAYWKGALAGVSVVDLPTDKPRRPAGAELAARGRLSVPIPKSFTGRLQALARAEKATLFQVVTAAVTLLFHKYTGEDDIAFAVPSAGRCLPELEAMVGCTVNTVTYRIDCSGDPEFTELLRRTHQAALAAASHQYVPFSRVAQLMPEAQNMTKILVNSAGVLTDVKHGGMYLKSMDLHFLEAPMVEELLVSITEGPDSLAIELAYDSYLFSKETMNRMKSHLSGIIHGVGEAPSQHISAFGLCTVDEVSALMAFNPKPMPYPDKLLHELFEEQVRRTPNADAVLDSRGGRLTYAEMNTKANRLARRLLELGAHNSGRMVGLCTERHVDMILGLMAIVKAGCAYVPIDPAYPQERIRLMVEDADCTVVVTERALAAKEELKFMAAEGRTTVLLEEPESWPSQDTNLTEAERGFRLTNRDLAYCIYTSGSTGRPKGVMLEHRGAVSLVHWLIEWLGKKDLEMYLQATSLSFDPSVHEIFSTLLCGGCLIVVKDIMTIADLDPKLKDRITFVSTVPSAACELAGAGLFPKAARVCCVGGEALQQSHVDTITPHLKDKLINFYGPTEATVLCTYSHGPSVLTIGNAIPNALLYVVDTGVRNMTPLNVPGELLVGGIGVARGYLNRPEMTAERFIQSPFDSGNVYRTGDLVARLPDGNIRFIGRRDNQVKIRGKRLELGEVENAVARLPIVNEVAVLAVKGELVCFVVSNKEGAKSADLRDPLSAELPKHMVPTRYHFLAELPLMPNRKFNRHALKKMAEDGMAASAADSAAAAGDYEPPQDETEATIARLFGSVLGLTRPVGRREKFFDIGGQSIIAVRFVSMVRNEAGCDVGLSVLYEDDSVAAFALAVKAAVQAARGDCEVANRDGAEPPPPVVLASVVNTVLQFVLSPLPLLTSSGTLVLLLVAWHQLAKNTNPYAALVALPFLNIVFHIITLLVWIPLKWLLVGRLRAGAYSVRSITYLRWRLCFLVESAVTRSLAYFQFTCFARPLLRALGAKIGDRAAIMAMGSISDWDLLHVGEAAVVEECVVMRAGTLRAGTLVLGEVQVGDNCVLRPKSRCLGGAVIPAGFELPSSTTASNTHPRAARMVRRHTGVGGLGADRPSSVGVWRARRDWWIVKLIVGFMTVLALIPPALPFLLWYEFCDINQSLCDWERDAMSVSPGKDATAVLRFFVILSALAAVVNVIGPILYTGYCIVAKRLLGKVMRRSHFRELMLKHMFDHILFSSAMTALGGTRLHAGVWKLLGVGIGNDVKLAGDFHCTHPDLVSIEDFAQCGGLYLGSLAGSVRRLPITVGVDAKVGPGSVLLPGTTVGVQGSIVAGSATELAQHVEAGTTVCGAPALRQGIGRMGRLVNPEEGDLYPWVDHAAPLGQVVDRFVDFDGSVVRHFACALVFQPACLLPGYMFLTLDSPLFFFLLLPPVYVLMAVFLSTLSKFILVGWPNEQTPLKASWRHAAADSIVGLATVPLLVLAGCPLYNVWLRLLGMKVGSGVVMLSPPPPAETMVTLKDGAVIGRDVTFDTIAVLRGKAYLYPSEVGEGAAICDGAALSPDVVVGRESIVLGGSRVDKSDRVPQRRTVTGSPAKPVRTGSAERAVMPRQAPERAADLIQFAMLPEHFFPSSPDLPVAAAWDHVFVTGSTGFMGSFLLQELVTMYPQCKLLCLVRCKNPSHGRERLRGVLEKHKLEADRILVNVEVIPGDLTKERFGMTPGEWKELAQRLDKIFSVGARVNHFDTHKMLKPSHVDALKQMMELSIMHPTHLVPVHHVSTGSVAIIPDTAHRYFMETEVETTPEIFALNLAAVGYCQAKIVSENCIVQARTRGIPAHIHRIGSLNGDSRNACLNASDAQTMQLSGWLALGHLPEAQMNNEWVYTPVDFACAAMVAAAAGEEDGSFVHHLFGPHRVTYGELVNFANKELLFGMKPVSYVDYREIILGFPGELEVRDYDQEILSHVRREADYRMGAKGLDFLEQDCSATYARLAQRRVAYPLLCATYWKKVWIGVLDHLIEHGTPVQLPPAALARVEKVRAEVTKITLEPPMRYISALMTPGAGEMIDVHDQDDADLYHKERYSSDPESQWLMDPADGDQFTGDAQRVLGVSARWCLNLVLAFLTALAVGAAAGFPAATVSSGDYGGCKEEGNSRVDCDLELGTTAKWWFEALLPLGAAATSVLCAILSSFRVSGGRRLALFFGTLVLACGQFGLDAANTTAGALASRAVAGLGCGIVSATLPAWLAEVAPKDLRGTCAAVFPVGYSAGLLAAFAVSSPAPAGFGESWHRLALGSGCVTAVVALLWVFADESPRWLASMGNRRDALKTLYGLRSSEHKGLAGGQYGILIAETYGVLRCDARAAATHRLRSAAVVGVSLLVAERCCGVGVTERHVLELFASGWHGGDLDTPSRWALGFTAGTALLAALCGCLLDTLGRRGLLSLSAIVAAVGGGVVAVWYMQGADDDKTSLLAGLVAYGVAAAALRTIPWVISAELSCSGGPATASFPEPDESAAGVASALWWLAGLLVLSLWSPLSQAAGPSDDPLHKGRGAMFIVFATVSVVTLLGAWRFVPETRGLSPQALLRAMRRSSPLTRRESHMKVGGRRMSRERPVFVDPDDSEDDFGATQPMRNRFGR
eukprot:Hpha_TRINITY_DN14628_c0_g2::TRINITY_DN14628_c0_g2_i1::g.47682::m.47682